MQEGVARGYLVPLPATGLGSEEEMGTVSVQSSKELFVFFFFWSSGHSKRLG